MIINSSDTVFARCKIITWMTCSNRPLFVRGSGGDRVALRAFRMVNLRKGVKPVDRFDHFFPLQNAKNPPKFSSKPKSWLVSGRSFRRSRRWTLPLPRLSVYSVNTTINYYRRSWSMLTPDIRTACCPRVRLKSQQTPQKSIMYTQISNNLHPRFSLNPDF